MGISPFFGGGGGRATFKPSLVDSHIFKQISAYFLKVVPLISEIAVEFKRGSGLFLTLWCRGHFDGHIWR